VRNDHILIGRQKVFFRTLLGNRGAEARQERLARRGAVDEHALSKVTAIGVFDELKYPPAPPARLAPVN